MASIVCLLASCPCILLTDFRLMLVLVVLILDARLVVVPVVVVVRSFDEDRPVVRPVDDRFARLGRRGIRLTWP